jgi:hypothetical protein
MDAVLTAMPMARLTWQNMIQQKEIFKNALLVQKP